MIIKKELFKTLVEIQIDTNKTQNIYKSKNLGYKMGKGKKWSIEEDNLLKKLYGKDYSKNLKGYFKNRSEKAIVLRAYFLKLNASNLKGKYHLKKLPKTAEKLSSDLAYILGVILGDGSINMNRRIRLQVPEDELDFALNFKEKLEKWGGLKAKIKKLKKKLKKNPLDDKIWKRGYYLELNSASAVKIIQGYLKNLNKIANKYIPFILGGLFDGDGSVCVRGYRRGAIYIEKTDKGIIKFIKRSLEKFNIRARYSARKIVGFKDYHRLNIEAKGDICLFSKIIKFSIKKRQKKLDELVYGITHSKKDYFKKYHL